MSDDVTAASGDTGTQGGDDVETITPEEARKLREMNQRLKGQLTDVEKKYSTFSSMYKDIDPDEARALKEEKIRLEKELAAKDPAKQRDLHDRELQKIRDDYENKIKEREERLSKLEKVNKTLAVTDRVLGKIGKLFTDDGLALLKRVVEDRCDLDDDGTIVVKDESGEIMYKGARPITVEEFGEELVRLYPSTARATGTPGGKDAVPGEKKPGRFKIPESWDEWQAMPNRDAVWGQLDHEARRRIAKTKRFGT